MFIDGFRSNCAADKPLGPHAEFWQLLRTSVRERERGGNSITVIKVKAHIPEEEFLKGGVCTPEAFVGKRHADLLAGFAAARARLPRTFGTQ